jgi:two-component system response regulator LytT
LRIAICDDQLQCRKQTEEAVRECLKGLEYGVELFKDGFEFLQAFGRKPYDLVLLDIEMPKIDGISLAKELRKLHKDVPIVFLTSHIEYALEGYEVNALRYLTKPVSIPKLREVLSCVRQRMQEQRILWVKTELGDQKLPVREIVFMEAQNQNILIYTTGGTYNIRYNLSDYQQELASDGFFRIHRGYLVSLGHVKSVGKCELTMDNGAVLPVSRAKEKELKEALFQYIQREAI